MRHRKIKFIAKVFGMTTPIGVVKVATLAKIRQADTVRICPKCKRKVREGKNDTDCIEHSQEYKCPCGEHYSWWGQLLQAVRATGQIIEKVRLLDPKEIPEAQLYKIPMDKFRAKVSAVVEDNAIIPEDATTARNLAKIIIATTLLGYVVVCKFNDTNEERVCALALNPDDTIVLKELIPDNLLEVNEEVMKADKTAFQAGEIEEAKAFLTMVPEATDSVFTVSDYRTIGLEEKTVSPKVMELQAILANKGRVEGMSAPA